MRTHSSSNLVGETSTNLNPKGRNRRRSKQRVEPFSLEETPVVTMTDQRTMTELLRAPTEGYAEAIVVPPISAKIMPPKFAPMTQAAIRRMIRDSVDVTIIAKLARQANVRNDASGSGPVRGQDAAPAVRECTFSGFMKYNHAIFREGKKVKFSVATLKGPALTWWKTKVATMGLETMNQMPWTKMKQLMTMEFFVIEEVQRMEHELWNLKVKEYDVVAYTQRFNELDLMCPRMVEPEIAKSKEIRELWLPLLLMESFLCVNDILLAMLASVRSSVTSVEMLGIRQGHTRNRCPNKVKPVEVGEARGRAYAIKDAEPQGPNVVTGTFLLNNRYAFVLINSGSDRSFLDTRFSAMLDIDPIKIGACYEVKLVDGRVASTNTILKGYTLNLVNHMFEIDLMPIELGTFGVIIGMDWLVKHDAVIVCDKKVVRIPYGNEMLIVKSNKGVSRLNVILCIKAYVPVIRDFSEVFPEEFPGLPPPRQVEFQIDLVAGAAPVARAPYRLIPSEMKELPVQLQELLKKGFIQEHEKHLKIILELLKKERLYAKFLKWGFWLDSVQSLGHMIDRSGVHVDPAKIKAIKS
uniref:Putative reverse transcriptase domain-containing protein n=1 Tax=Tanacetum cinerariifolium TaxID=118510 RepID=A0A6L2MU21_TANCI|nr:putative reverse transcriptase domain-containing protein [Tanacetum cinerariifolium]